MLFKLVIVIIRDVMCNACMYLDHCEQMLKEFVYEWLTM